MENDSERQLNTRWYYLRVFKAERRNPNDVPLRVELQWRGSAHPTLGSVQGIPLKAFRDINQFVEWAAKELGGTR